MSQDRSIVETSDTALNSLFKVGGVAALMVAVFVPIQIIVFVVSPPPGTVIGWFTLFQSNKLLGLLDMDLLLIVDQILFGLIFLALYIALRRASQSLMAIALIAGLVAIVAYLSSAVAFEMLSLSDQYAAATTDAERSVLLAAGQVMIGLWSGTAYDISYVLEGITFLIISAVMLRSTRFGKAAALAGILLGVMSLLPPTVGTIGLIFSLGSLLPLEIWLILIARGLIRPGRLEAEALPQLS